ENYQISGSTIAEEPEFVRGMVAVKKASAMANRKLGTLSDTIADAIIWACDEILEDGRCLDQFPIDVFQGGAGTSVNMNT
ncbi:lyase family protein, partial [Aerococcus urinae]|nr:lyase family protein [Aerococcus urinae]